jgi:hypothetical protein
MIHGSRDSKLGNLSTRGFVGAGDMFLSADLLSATWLTPLSSCVPRAVTCPSVTNALSDPILTIYDSNGVAIRVMITGRAITWLTSIRMDGATNAAESATILHPPAGLPAIVSGADNAGVASSEIPTSTDDCSLVHNTPIVAPRSSSQKESGCK